MNSKEALEFLTEGICNCHNCSKYVECMDLDESESVCENAKFIIKKDLIKLEQLEKALDILKKIFEIKNVHEEVDVYVIETETYLLSLSQEEYKLLKEVLEDDKNN